MQHGSEGHTGAIRRGLHGGGVLRAKRIEMARQRSSSGAGNFYYNLNSDELGNTLRRLDRYISINKIYIP
jgi:hypothetical protein